MKDRYREDKSGQQQSGELLWDGGEGNAVKRVVGTVQSEYLVARLRGGNGERKRVMPINHLQVR